VLLDVLYMGNIYIAFFPWMGVVVDIRIWPLVAGSISRHAWILPNRAALASPGQSNDVLDHCCSVHCFQKACGCRRRLFGFSVWSASRFRAVLILLLRSTIDQSIYGRMRCRNEKRQPSSIRLFLVRGADSTVWYSTMSGRVGRESSSREGAPALYLSSDLSVIQALTTMS
jgi:hypothetical protein